MTFIVGSPDDILEMNSKLPHCAQVRNKTPALTQITAEQILREAREQQEVQKIRPPSHKITDTEELEEYRLQKQKEFEDLIRRARRNTSVWVKYALWEERQGDLALARSVWERALEVDYTNTKQWMKYNEMVMTSKFTIHARNVWERAVSLLPRVDQLWYRYIHMEEMSGNVAEARQIFERWMTWQPGHHGWAAYIRFELRYKERERSRAIYNRAIECNDDQTEDLFLAIAEFDEGFKEPERQLNGSSRFQIEDVVVRKKRLQYEEEVKEEPLNYDTWFDYVRLEENAGDIVKVREVYERAIGNVPPVEEKRYWHRYMYLWINYAHYEELEAEDKNKTRTVYKACLGIIPHTKFTFGKVWIMAAKFEIRQKNLKAARKLLGNAVRRAPKDKLFEAYIEIELELGNINRYRTLYEKYLKWSPANSLAWRRYAQMEMFLGEIELARSVFESAIKQPLLDRPELLWKGYLEFEISQGEHRRARDLYEKLLDRTQHLMVWLSYAKFEAAVPLKEEAAAQEEGREPDVAKVAEQAEKRARRTRKVFDRAYVSLQGSVPEQKEEKAVLLEEWKEAEYSLGAFGHLAAVERYVPKKLKRKRHVNEEMAGFEAEYPDYVFPKEAGMVPTLKVLKAAYEWKRRTAEFW